MTDCKVKIGQLHTDQLWKISGYLVIALNASGYQDLQRTVPATSMNDRFDCRAIAQVAWWKGTCLQTVVLQLGLTAITLR